MASQQQARHIVSDELGARIAVLDKWMLRQTLDGLDIDEQGVMARADTQFEKLSENMALSN